MKEGWNQNIDSNQTAECPSLAFFLLFSYNLTVVFGLPQSGRFSRNTVMFAVFWPAFPRRTGVACPPLMEAALIRPSGPTERYRTHQQGVNESLSVMYDYNLQRLCTMRSMVCGARESSLRRRSINDTSGSVIVSTGKQEKTAR